LTITSSDPDCDDNTISYTVSGATVSTVSMPIAMSSGGQMTIYSTDNGDASTYNLVVTALIKFSDGSSTSFDYDMTVVVTAQATKSTVRQSIVETYVFDMVVDS